MTKYHHGNLRQALLERAVEVIGQDGVEALTLRALARDLNVSHGAPARHFKTRNDLLRALAIEGYEHLTKATLDASAYAGDDPIVKLRAMGRAYMKWALEHRAFFQTIIHPDVTRYADDTLKAALNKFISAISEAVIAAQKHGWCSQVPSAMLTQYAIVTSMGLAFNLTNPLYTDLFGDPSDQAVDELVDIIMRK